MLSEAKAYAESIKIAADNQAKILKMEAENRLEAAKLRTQALILEADAEGANAQNLDNKRRHEQRMKLAEDMTELVKHNKIILSGKQGE